MAYNRYPGVYIDFRGIPMISGVELNSSIFLQKLVEAMRNNDAFAEAMAEFIDYDTYANGVLWEDITYENLAIDTQDYLMADFNEWESLMERGREDNDWCVISDDESIEIGIADLF